MFDIPQGAIAIINQLQKCDFEAYLVGGCVRDMIMGVTPHDWDITTSATPEEVKFLFTKVIETGIQHGTVTVVLEDDQYEVTTFRLDGKYSDGRRPDSVEYTRNLIQDLSRRDFTMNAIAYNPTTGGFIDPFNGQKDIERKAIVCVGDPNQRFQEDGLRILRAIRFSSKLNFYIRNDVDDSMILNVDRIQNISYERINSEITKCLLSENPSTIMEYPEILTKVIPEFIPTIDYDQNSIWHSKTLYDHMKYALMASSFFDKDVDLSVRLAVMLHDISKPDCMTLGEDGHSHFKGHGVLCAKTAKDILQRLRYDHETVEKVYELILYHDVFINEDKKSIRKWLNKIGEAQLKRLLVIRECDLIAQNPEFFDERRQKVIRIRNLLEEVLSEKPCVKITDLAINGRDIMNLGVPEGKEVGNILKYLLSRIIENPEKNNREELIQIAGLKIFWDKTRNKRHGT